MTKAVEKQKWRITPLAGGGSMSIGDPITSVTRKNRQMSIKVTH